MKNKNASYVIQHIAAHLCPAFIIACLRKWSRNRKFATEMRQLLTILVVTICAIAASSATPRWEGVDMPVPELSADSRDSDSNIDVSVKDGYVYVATPRKVTVKLFTILGQLISEATLDAGTHRLRISARGVYILKAGTSTRRVTI